MTPTQSRSPADILRAARDTIRRTPKWGRDAAATVNKILGAHDSPPRKLLNTARVNCPGRSGSRAYTIRWFDRAIILAEQSETGAGV